jgi:uncharacterized repeat protein (TIGR02543 family)
MKKRSLILSVLLTIAMVFTMMPAMVFAEPATTGSASYLGYFKAVSDLGDGEYVITVEDAEGDVYALATPADETTGAITGATLVQLENGEIVDPDESVVWFVDELSSGGCEIVSNDGMLYFSSTGLKYQSLGYRPVSLDTNNHMYGLSEKSGNPKHYLAFDETNKEFMISANDNVDGAATVTLYKRSYSLDFVMGEAGTPIDTMYTEFVPGTGDSLTMPADPSDPNYVFEGWFTDDAFTEPWGPMGGDSAILSTDTTLYAKWTYHGAAVEEAKNEAKKQINGTDLGKYKADQQAAIKNAMAAATAKVDAAGTMEEVNAALTSFNAFVAAQPTASDVDYLAKVTLKNKKVKGGKKKLTIKWKPKASAFDGYEVWYKTKGKGWASVQVASPTAAKATVKGLTKGKKYTAKVRGYKLYGQNKEVKVFGKFSKSKKVKVK